MQKQQVFKVKGMQRDASMANANGEFAYEIINMRLLPSEENAGFSLTNEKGTTKISNQEIRGTILGQCPTTDSLIVFTKDLNVDYIYKISNIDQSSDSENPCKIECLYGGNLNFNVDFKIEALFNYETTDIQKVYWIDGINQLRCINISSNNIIPSNNDTQFDSVKEVPSLPFVNIERTTGGNFTAGVIQYYVTYFNEFSSESPIVYISPLLYIANLNRGADTNEQVNTAFRLTLFNLDNKNWNSIRIYVTHRTSLNATPEGAIVHELAIPTTGSIEYIDFGSSRVSIAPTDLLFVGSKFVKAGTMTVKDQVMFLGNLDIEYPNSVDYEEITSIFNKLRQTGKIHNFFSTETVKYRDNKLSEYEDTHYVHKSTLNNTSSITHYKYGEKYRFGISIMDKYGTWSNPIWLTDDFITVAPKQVDQDHIALPCPTLFLDRKIEGETTLLDKLISLGMHSIRPLVVFPKVDERKVIAQGVVCPTVYNLKDRRENGPYAQASWFMRPNSPIDLWGVRQFPMNIKVRSSVEEVSSTFKDSPAIYHYSDLMVYDEESRSYFGYFGAAAETWEDLQMEVPENSSSNIPSPYQYAIDDGNGWKRSTTYGDNNKTLLFSKIDNAWINIKDHYIGKDETILNPDFPIESDQVFYENVIQKGSWVEFRHNYALRSKGWSFGAPTGVKVAGEWKGKPFGFGVHDEQNDHEGTGDVILGGHRSAELGSTRYQRMLPVNRVFVKKSLLADSLYFRKDMYNNSLESNYMLGNSAYYVDSSIVTLNSPEFEISTYLHNASFEDTNFRVIGMVPLTATSSDIYLDISSTSANPDSVDVGLHKAVLNNKNIGHHGFKGMVSANAYYAKPKDDSYGYQTVLLNPWHTEGTVMSVASTANGFGDSNMLKRKVLSNLRYSASSYYFDNISIVNTSGVNLSNTSDETMNIASFSKEEDRCIGWRPANGISATLFNLEDDGIVKLINGLDQKDLVYKGNIKDVIATPTLGESYPTDIMASTNPIGAYGSDRDEPIFYNFVNHKFSGKGTSMNYKSSPHVVIAFKEFPKQYFNNNLNKRIQEILPSLCLVNSTGFTSGLLEASYDILEPSESIDDAQGVLYEDTSISSWHHQAQLCIGLGDSDIDFGLPGYSSYVKDTVSNSFVPTYGWLWLGEIYRDDDPTFGGNSEYALKNNLWEIGGPMLSGVTELNNLECETNTEAIGSCSIEKGYSYIKFHVVSGDKNYIFTFDTVESFKTITSILDPSNDINNIWVPSKITFFETGYESYATTLETNILVERQPTGETSNELDLSLTLTAHDGAQIYLMGITIFRIPISLSSSIMSNECTWTIGDTYYQRFDTLKTYAVSEENRNSIVDITSFMVETRVNADGRYDRNRGQESNNQMSPEIFNLVNDVYTQGDNFFTYRILDDDSQARTKFPNQITWSLSKTAGASVDAWLNITLASVLDLDGTKGKVTALKTFNDNIIAFQDSGISTILFNSRVQIPTSEAVPIQIANSGKVDGQQMLVQNIGCQDKWNIVSTSQGLYFIDYYNKSIYRFNGKIEDLSLQGGFRGWCSNNISADSNIIGYFDIKNHEVMFYNNAFACDQYESVWLGFSELTNTFSSFYTYPEAILTSVQGIPLWLYDNNVYTHQTGSYNRLLREDWTPFYGLSVIARQDSNRVKTFNNVEFRADSFGDSVYNDFILPFDTISAETEYQDRTTDPLTYNPYRPSSLKKKLRTWRANMPRVNNSYKRFVNQWAKIGLWKMSPSVEKTILHDLSVWYSE